MPMTWKALAASGILIAGLGGLGLFHARGAAAIAPTPLPEESPAPKEARKDRSDPSVGGLPADTKTTGAIQGRVVLKGKLAPAITIKIPADHKDRPACGEEIPDEKVILGPGNTLSNTVVSLVKVAGAPKAEKRTIALDNLHCRFVPHVQATTVGSTLKITNHDEGVLHSAMALANATFNVSVSGDQPLEKQLLRPGWVPIRCAVHSWMEAYIWVFPHDFFAVTQKEGKFRIEGIPPGKYQVKFWHEGPIDEATQEVTVEAGKTADLQAEMKTIEG
jgi:hypothetical protein